MRNASRRVFNDQCRYYEITKYYKSLWDGGKLIKKEDIWDCPGGLVVKTLCFCFREHGKIHGWGTEILPAVRCSQKTKVKTKQKPFLDDYDLKWVFKEANMTKYFLYLWSVSQKDESYCSSHNNYFYVIEIINRIYMFAQGTTNTKEAGWLLEKFMCRLQTPWSQAPNSSHSLSSELEAHPEVHQHID